jgi:hypothetical protein
VPVYWLEVNVVFVIVKSASPETLIAPPPSPPEEVLLVNVHPVIVKSPENELIAPPLLEFVLLLKVQFVIVTWAF